MIKIAINGFGRIGRLSLKVAMAKKDIEVVGINDLTDIKTAAHLLKHDSSYGVYDKEIEVNEKKGELIVGKKKIKFFAEPNPEKIPWKSLKVNIVLEGTGIFTKHAEA